MLVAAGLVLTADCGAFAGPQSVLDPYLNIQAPATASRGLSNRMRAVKQPKARAVAPRENKVSPPVPVRESSRTPAPAAGSMSGPKEIVDGIARTTKAAGSGVVKGTKKISGGIGAGVKAAGHGIMLAGGKIKDGTGTAGSKLAAAPRVIGHGLKATGGRIVDGTQFVGQKVAVVPRAIGHGLVATASKVKDGGGAVGKRVAAVPAAMGHGVGKLFGRGGSKATATASSGGAH